MRIAIIGAGNVGRGLAATAAGAGLEVAVGRRDPSDRAGLPDEVEVTTPQGAARAAEAIFLTVPASSAVETARGLGLRPGALLIDATNPVGWSEGPVLEAPPAGSVTAELQAALPDCSIVKALNHFGAEIHADPGLTGIPSDALVAGADPDARARVLELLDRLGFRAHDAGPLRNAAHLESMAILWIQLAGSGTGRRWVFQIRTDD